MKKKFDINLVSLDQLQNTLSVNENEKEEKTLTPRRLEEKSVRRKESLKINIYEVEIPNSGWSWIGKKSLRNSFHSNS